ncbi:glycoside hydrolase family 16 protein [Nocardioides daphniae]|uniref:GH16 domain-containing protein n=1 Tax=Nocardioides daphniae TaxID=402297 RepID=A0ABQ1QGH8_9ACTN|nr:glycoside hydrolase family 16 protein [Nocardioides daphniae]GGD26930.1 hypothetical protein GCM10007231_27950 [Nocardioides daphniae]
MFKRARVGSVAAALGVSTVLVATQGAVPEPAAAAAAKATVERTLTGKAITESSGLARSTYRRPVLFTHNDSGDGPRVFAVDAAGKTRGKLRLKGASAVDWEDIASGPRHSIWVGDIGDNQRTRKTVAVYRFTEPKRLPSKGRTVKVAAKKFRFAYPDRPRDAEALLVHPKNGRVFIVTKSTSGSAGVYRAPAKLSTKRVNKLTRVAKAPENITAGSFSPDGKTRVLGSYTKAYTYKQFISRPAEVTLPERPQGESLEVNRRGTKILLGSEGVRSRVLQIAMTKPVKASSSSPAPAPTTPASCATSNQWKPELDDDFNALDPKVWNVKNNTYASNEDSYLRAQNVSVKNGVLRLQAKKEAYRGRNYTSGYVESIGKYTLPSTFRAEVRAKVPLEQGMWAAPLWFRPTDGQAGEIDLVETYGNEHKAGRAAAHHTIHTEYGSTHKQSVRSKKFSELSGSATGWHTYTIEKTPGKITMWVDCVKTAEFTHANPSWYKSYYDVGDRWNLRINLQVGGIWGGLPDGSTDWSPDKTAMQLDYLKTWVHK